MITQNILMIALIGAVVAPGEAQDTTSVVAQDTSVVQVDYIAAVVGDVAIPNSQVEEAMLTLRRAMQEFPTDSASLAAFRTTVVEQLIENELIKQAAEADTAVVVTDEQVNSAVDDRMRQDREQYGSELEYDRALRQAGIGTQDERRRQIADQLRLEMLKQGLIARLTQGGILRSIPPTESEMHEFFDENKMRLGVRPPTVTFRQIVVRPKADSAAINAAFAEADSILRLLQEGAEFEEMARIHSDDPGSRENGGSLGWFRRGKMAREFTRVAFRLRPGALSRIVPTQFGFHIIRVDRVDAAEVNARHILFTPEVTDDNRAVARALADSVAVELRAGGPYDSLIVLHHDPEEETLANRVVREQLPPFYANAIADANPGDVLGPVAIPDPTGERYAVLIFEEALEEGEYTFDELRDRIREQMADENGIKRYVDELRKATYVEIRQPKSALRSVASASKIRGFN